MDYKNLKFEYEKVARKHSKQHSFYVNPEHVPVILGNADPDPRYKSKIY